jgi:hypothetical protein
VTRVLLSGLKATLRTRGPVPGELPPTGPKT